MHHDVKISGARIRTHDLWTESECATHYTTAPHKDRSTAELFIEYGDEFEQADDHARVKLTAER